MNTKTICYAGLLAALIFFVAVSAPAQTVTLTSTTTSATLLKTDKEVCLTSATGVKVPGRGTAGSLIYVGVEPITIRAKTDYSDSCFEVVRDKQPSEWATGTTVYIGDPKDYKNHAPLSGSACVLANMDVRPWIDLSGRYIWDCVNSKMQVINGPAQSATGLTALTPNAASTVDVGSDAAPFRTGYFTSSLQFEGSTANAYESTLTFTDPTADRTITVPDASITIPGTVYNDCGTANACSAALKSSVMKMVSGVTAALDGASPSVAAVTGMPAFTSSSSYHCTASLQGATAAIAAKGVAVNYVSASAVTFTSANAATEKVEYICIGW